MNRELFATALLLGNVVLGCGEDSCFVAGTLVATPRGARRIEDLAPGDVIFSWNAQESKLVEREVRQLLRDQATTVCKLRTEVGEIRGVTPSHPFYIVERDAYLALRDVPNDVSFLALPPEGGTEARVVRALSLSIHESPTPNIAVYNLEVEGPDHNFFADGVLVHNKEPPYGVCGDKVIGYGESCDDGNTVPGDGCSEFCAREDGASGATGASGSTGLGGGSGASGSAGNGGLAGAAGSE